MPDKRRISKFLSYVLRHNPEKFGIGLDKSGFAKFADIVKITKDRFPGIDKNTIISIIEDSPKKRFEVSQDKIRATYGHSIKIKEIGAYTRPPDILYHGTSPTFLDRIKSQGLKPMGLVYVHLSSTKEEAKGVGMRKSKKPVILIINAKRACKDGLKFKKSGDVFLVEEMPPEYIESE